MAETCATLDLSLSDRPRLDAVAGVANMFPWPIGREGDDRVRNEVAYLVDGGLEQISCRAEVVEVAMSDSRGMLDVRNKR